MPLKVNPKTAVRWIADHYPRHRVSAEDDHILRLQDCPLCGHRKWSVWFNSKSQRLTCFRCQGHMEFVDMVKEAKGFKRMQDVFTHLKSYGELNFLWQRGPSGPDMRKVIDEILSVPPRVPVRGDMLLDSFSTDFSTSVGKAILAYGRKRNLPETLLQSGLVGYFRTGPLVGRLSFLICEDGKPVFTVGRAIRPGVEPKYLYPHSADCGGRRASSVIYNIDAVKPGDVVPAAEGIISAISADPKCQAMLGNVLSSIQAAKLAAKEPGGVIFLREQGIDAAHTEESAARMWAKGVPAFIADLIDGDPNDNPDQMPQVYAGARSCDWTTQFMATIEKIP